jgi:3-deoxy-D-manno-octulosonate 8-phosphate phosphatase (KDO 8-P phosphatase)
MKFSIDLIDALIFDFDGVLTDNSVFVNDKGEEFVKCNRGDGLAFEDLKRLGLRSFIVSAEKNKVVEARGKKLDIPVIHGVKDKSKVIKKLAVSELLNLMRVLYIGNDLNDLRAMKLCGFSACPSDSHQSIKEASTFILKKTGGSGIVREIIDDIFKADVTNSFYLK